MKLDRLEKTCVIIVILLLSTCGVCTAMLISDYNYQMSLPYYEQIYIADGFERWQQPLINITATGDISKTDWYALEDVINEWNSKIEYPRLGYNNQYPDIEITFDRFDDESWAGCAWVHSNNKIITHGWINIRTSWSFSREHVIRHEIGHAIGLGYHSNHPNSTMYKWASGVPEWSAEDIHVIQQIYSNPPGMCVAS